MVGSAFSPLFKQTRIGDLLPFSQNDFALVTGGNLNEINDALGSISSDAITSSLAALMIGGSRYPRAPPYLLQ